MKKYSVLLLTFFLFYNANAAYEEKKIKTKIDKVNVYLNGALISHTGTVSLDAGNTVVIIHNISSKIEKESIRATFTNGVKVLAVDYDIDRITSGVQDSLRIKKVNDSITLIQKDIRRLNSVMAALESERKVISDNSHLLSSSSTSNMTVAELQKLADFYRLRITDINKQVFQIQETISEFYQKINSYNSEITKMRSVVKTEYFHQIKLIVNADGPVTSSLNLKYVAGGAGWTPKYDIRAEGVDAGINIDYNAHVMNQTGEPWNDVKIILSTADPIQSHNLPSLPAWTLNYSNQQSGEGRLNEYGPRKITNDEAQRQYGNIKVLEGVEYEEVDVSNIAVDFDIKGTYTIPSDSKPYLLEVATHKLNASFQYYTVPKSDKDAFLLAQITGWEKLNLIEGQTNIYFRGMYIGHSYIKPQYANDTLDISMGRDNKVMVNRIKVEDKDAVKIIGVNKTETFTYKITVRNTNQTPVRIEIVDQVPVSQHSDITVDVHNVSGAEWDKLSGILKWTLDLKANESKEIAISFTVKYPKNKPIKVAKTEQVSYKKARAKF
jgi:uncharacterized protein (TIGR02231 family)